MTIRSYGAEVLTAGDGDAWTRCRSCPTASMTLLGNELRFLTHDSAIAYACDLRSRWCAVTAIRAVPLTDEPNIYLEPGRSSHKGAGHRVHL